MIFILFSSAYHSPSTRRGNHCFVVSYPLCFVLKSVSLLSLSNACFLQIKSLHTTHNVPN